MHHWPPFLPPNEWLTLDNSTRENVCRIWLHQCERLLRADDEAFWEEILENPPLLYFLHTFLRHYRAVVSVRVSDTPEAECMPGVYCIKNLPSLVLSLLQRLVKSSTIAEEYCRPDTALSCFVSLGLFDAPGLLDIVATFGRSNRQSVGEIIDQVIKQEPSVREQLASMMGHIVRYIREAVVSLKDDGHKTDQVNGSISTLSPDNIWSTLLDLAATLDTFVYVCRHQTYSTSYLEIASGELIRSLDVIYNVTRSIDPTKLTASQRLAMRRFKYASISLVYHLLDYYYLAPLAKEHTDNGDDDAMLKEQSACATRLCDLLLQLLDTSENTENDITFMETASLLVDLEMEFSLSKRMTPLRTVFEKCNEYRVEYVILSLEHLRGTIGADMKNLQDRFAEMRTREIYLAQERIHTKQADVTEIQPVNEEEIAEVQRINAIEQVRGIFPDLGEGFIEACLQVYQNDVATVISCLLEDNLDDSLRILDRQAPQLPPRPSCTAIETSVCEPDLLSSRKNIYDNDEFDIFAHGTLDKSRVHMGKKKTGDAAQLLDDKTFIQRHKAALLERIYSHDEYDDEYDDTYDGLGETPVLDAVTTEDATDAISDPTAPFEAELVQRWMSNPSLFERTSRRSKDREQLRKLTSLTDEQIEGWAIQLQRNPRKDQILEKYEWRGEQQEIVSTPQDAPRGRRRGGGQTHQQQPEDTARARALKDRNKAARGNHNRKRGYARKMRSTLPTNDPA